MQSRKQLYSKLTIDLLFAMSITLTQNTNFNMQFNRGWRNETHFRLPHVFNTFSILALIWLLKDEVRVRDELSLLTPKDRRSCFKDTKYVFDIQFMVTFGLCTLVFPSMNHTSVPYVFICHKHNCLSRDMIFKSQV